MCGKFTAMATWAQVVAFSQPLTSERYDKSGQPDREVTYRVIGNLPVIVWDRRKGRAPRDRHALGFPHRQDWRRPQPSMPAPKPTETTRAFTEPFHDGQRGIVIFRTREIFPRIREIFFCGNRE